MGLFDFAGGGDATTYRNDPKPFSQAASIMQQNAAREDSQAFQREQQEEGKNKNAENDYTKSLMVDRSKMLPVFYGKATEATNKFYATVRQVRDEYKGRSGYVNDPRIIQAYQNTKQELGGYTLSSENITADANNIRSSNGKMMFRPSLLTAATGMDYDAFVKANGSPTYLSGMGVIKSFDMGESLDRWTKQINADKLIGEIKPAKVNGYYDVEKVTQSIAANPAFAARIKADYDNSEAMQMAGSYQQILTQAASMVAPAVISHDLVRTPAEKSGDAGGGFGAGGGVTNRFAITRVTPGNQGQFQFQVKVTDEMYQNVINAETPKSQGPKLTREGWAQAGYDPAGYDLVKNAEPDNLPSVNYGKGMPINIIDGYDIQNLAVAENKDLNWNFSRGTAIDMKTGNAIPGQSTTGNLMGVYNVAVPKSRKDETLGEPNWYAMVKTKDASGNPGKVILIPYKNVAAAIEGYTTDKKAKQGFNLYKLGVVAGEQAAAETGASKENPIPMTNELIKSGGFKKGMWYSRPDGSIQQYK